MLRGEERNDRSRKMCSLDAPAVACLSSLSQEMGRLVPAGAVFWLCVGTLLHQVERGLTSGASASVSRASASVSLLLLLFSDLNGVVSLHWCLA